ncbi:OsmC family protein [Streptomyces sp. SL13]|uniref:OsmC family protein n=1 Tax=Streptantibioticus silvisoli TaxID=2705255 RepID=A0AA90HAJ5_9ACTN|nr:OsmC family protein [Streptantibioticus silvisoli]MDI5964882.1 OsmC family protein [Streptantibioticus silvisoli]MDI5971122.1 OsmC family protein [Streptantibioticus silvisoli]
MTTTHSYEVTVEWTGDRGSGTSDYRAYGRDHEVLADGKPPIAASSDPAFLGDPARWNPEELLLASVAQCHMLWYLHLCAAAGVVVTGYEDRARAVLAVDATGGGGRITGVVLSPEVTVADPADLERAHALHDDVNALCFVARSVSFPITHLPHVAGP